MSGMIAPASFAAIWFGSLFLVICQIADERSFCTIASSLWCGSWLNVPVGREGRGAPW